MRSADVPASAAPAEGAEVEDADTEPSSSDSELPDTTAPAAPAVAKKAIWSHSGPIWFHSGSRKETQTRNCGRSCFTAGTATLLDVPYAHAHDAKPWQDVPDAPDAKTCILWLEPRSSGFFLLRRANRRNCLEVFCPGSGLFLLRRADRRNCLEVCCPGSGFYLLRHANRRNWIEYLPAVPASDIQISK